MPDEHKDPAGDEARKDEAPEDPKGKRFGNGAEERHGDEADAEAEAEEASKDSFPSSDPPAW
ncbi:MAG TPA: hypothetical protein VFS18_04635 [Actinomycetota bacterium]|nr:hypothetical protein [Actinomycetota bacterium]